MALRLLRVLLPASDAGRALEILKGASVDPLARHRVEDGRTVLEVLLEAEGSQTLLDDLEKTFRDRDGFRMVLVAAEAAIPRVDEEPREETTQGEKERAGLPGVSRAEIYEDLDNAVELDRTYLLLAFLASVVAAVGILIDSTAVVIGAMVIAPLLGPMVALAFATTLGDLDLARRAVVAGVVGTALALTLAVLVGFVAAVEPGMPQIAARVQLGYGDLVLALAAGSAGVLSMTAGVAPALVGVMVAVALLPPLITSGLLLGAGFLPEAGRAFLAFCAYVIGINLAGVVTFLAQGVQPLSWWEADRARKATRRAIGIWVLLLVALTGLVTWLR